MKIIRYFLICVAVFSFTSCGSFLEEYSQDHDYVKSWNDLNELLIGDCYMPVNNSGEFLGYSNSGMFLHLLSDEIEEQVSGPVQSPVSFDNHGYEFGYLTWQQRTGTKDDYTGFFAENQAWTKMYKYINVANNVLHSSENLPKGLDSEIAGANYVNGQAHFLRGFYYFWLVNAYGQPYNPSTASTDLGVPIKTSEEVVDVKYTRNTVQECYNQIVSDLLAAEKELSAGSSVKRKSIYRADSTSAILLLSRVYLYMQNWQKAAEYSQKLINLHSAIQDINSNNAAFQSIDNPETIFSMGGDDLPNFMCYASQSLRVSNSLYNLYSVNDARKDLWYIKYGAFQGVAKQPAVYNAQTYNRGQADYYWGYYTLTSDKRDISSLFWLRSGEAYLNLAEAEAYIGHEDAAREAVNKIRRARIYPSASGIDITSTGSQLITDIRNERKLEMAFEGQQWFDLRRYRVCGVQPEKTSITHTYTYYQDRGSANALETHKFVLKEEDASWTLPIPQEVIDFNVGMPNNGNAYREYETVSIPQ